MTPTEVNPLRDVGAIATALARRPQDIRRYASQGFRRLAPLDLGVPWFSFAAIDALDTLLRPDWTVAEYGSGGSTVFYAPRVARVVAAEHDPDWASRVIAEAARRGVDNVEVRNLEAVFSTGEALVASPFGRAFDDMAPDVVVIDCWTDGSGHDDLRPALFRHVEQSVQPAVIVVDDSYRYPELRAQTRAREVMVCRGVGPGRRRVTCTDIHVYDTAARRVGRAEHGPEGSQ